jgi:carbon monoxide dehydrogenase subunit G
MELTNDFRVALPIDRAWAVLTDLERIAPCMPGAQLQEVEGDAYRGVVKVKVGPVVAQYKGEATFLDRDEAAHVAKLRAVGRETRGQGNADATITATLTPDGEGTAVSMVTDLTITGRVAQFGRGVLADVSATLLDQFVESLEQTVLAGETSTEADESAATETVTEVASETAAAAAPEDTTTIRVIDSPEPTPVDLVGVARTSMARQSLAKRAMPAIVLGVLVLVLLRLRKRRRARRAQA